MEVQTYDELFEQSVKLNTDAEAILTKEGVTTEELGQARKMMDDAMSLRQRSKMMAELEALKADAAGGIPETKARAKGKFKSFGEFLCAVYTATQGKGTPDPRLLYKTFSDEPDTGPFTMENGWIETKEKKDLLENTGASGGFLVFPEHLTELFQLQPLAMYVRQRATVIPMRARVMQIPVLDQTSTTSGVSHYYAGVIPRWTEEAAYKDETEPAFRQMQLVAHKLVVYTEASDELLVDAAVSLEALLRQLYAGAIRNEEEWCFINGTGAGQPLGIANLGCINPAGPTIAVARQAANQIQILDIINMLHAFQGQSPIWLAHQCTMAQLLQLNGPAGNPSYLWIGNGRDQMPTTLMGYPIYFIENCQPLGTTGDIILADWSKYLIGDREAVTIDSSKHYRFRYDLTAWRAVHRVDGRPWLSAPLTYRNGTTQVSPFVVLDSAVAT